jgi:hypothetical protein
MHLGKRGIELMIETFLLMFSTVWYELLFREFPYAKQPPEYIIWRAGNSLKQPLSSVHISKNAKVNIQLF